MARTGRAYASEIDANPRSRAGADRTAELDRWRLRDDPVAAYGRAASAADAVSFGLTPVFLDSDIQLLSMLEAYLVARLGRPVQLVKRRTYQEITAMLLSGQLDAAWVCDDPYVQHEDQFALLAVPLYQPAAALPDLRHRQRGEQSPVL